MSYTLNYSSKDEVGKLDEFVSDKGVDIIIDSKAVMHVVGTTMDWKEDDMTAEFIFFNPKAKG
jgi:Fe-S cluster assembly iron-binding protein IscA